MLMVVIGVVAMIMARSYKIGTASAMGPGFFPLMVGAVIALAGVAIIAQARFEPDAASREQPKAEWRGWACIVCSLIAFIVLGQYAGLLPATFAAVFISALGDRSNSWRSALLLSLAICLVAVVVFWWLLQVQFPLFVWN